MLILYPIFVFGSDWNFGMAGSLEIPVVKIGLESAWPFLYSFYNRDGCWIGIGADNWLWAKLHSYDCYSKIPCNPHTAKSSASILSGPSTINSLPQIYEHSTLTATFWVVSFSEMLFNNSVFSLSNWDNSMFAFGQTSKNAEK